MKLLRYYIAALTLSYSVLLGSARAGTSSESTDGTPSRAYINIYIGTESNPKIDYTRVIINESASIDYEIGVDNTKTISTTAVCQIYSIGNNNTAYSINERPAGTGCIALGLLVNTTGTICFTPTRLDYTASIHDKALGITHDLSEGAYSFQVSEPGYITNRFELVVPGTVILGDADGNGVVNVGDITTVASFILGQTPEQFNRSAADANNDGNINVGDITTIASMILARQ